LIFTVVYYELI